MQGVLFVVLNHHVVHIDGNSPLLKGVAAGRNLFIHPAPCLLTPCIFKFTLSILSTYIESYKGFSPLNML